LQREYSFQNSVAKRGFAIARGVIEAGKAESALAHLEAANLSRSRAGARHILDQPCVQKLAKDPRVLHLAREILGANALPFRATLFDKSPNSNWLVVWHQDTAQPLHEKRETPGWGPWSIKDGVTYAHAPTKALEQILALRIHLNDSTNSNGPLQVIPGTHLRGVLTDEELQKLDAKIEPVTCTADRGEVIAMRPLIVHASSKSQSALPRRVLHIEYAAVPEFENHLRLATA